MQPKYTAVEEQVNHIELAVALGDLAVVEAREQLRKLPGYEDLAVATRIVVQATGRGIRAQVLSYDYAVPQLVTLGYTRPSAEAVFTTWLHSREV